MNELIWIPTKIDLLGGVQLTTHHLTFYDMECCARAQEVLLDQNYALCYRQEDDGLHHLWVRGVRDIPLMENVAGDLDGTLCCTPPTTTMQMLSAEVVGHRDEQEEED